MERVDCRDLTPNQFEFVLLYSFGVVLEIDFDTKIVLQLVWKEVASCGDSANQLPRCQLGIRTFVVAIGFAPGNSGTGTKWLVDATAEAKRVCPYCIITHAPQAPYFSTGFTANYYEVERQVGVGH